MKCLVAYLSYSGNTEEVAEIIAENLEGVGIEVENHIIGIDMPVDPADYDIAFLGTFTWEQGSTPDEMKDFVLEVGYKPNNIAVFGSGDTQFGGDELFCGAVDKLSKFYNSKYKGLKIEQSPRGSQEVLVEQWINRIIENYYQIAV